MKLDDAVQHELSAMVADEGLELLATECIPEIVHPHIHETSLAGAAYDAEIEHPPKHVREDGDDVYSHSLLR